MSSIEASPPSPSSAPTVSKLHINDLPRELLLKILGKVREGWTERKHNARTWVSCALVCKAWLPWARVELYRDFEFRLFPSREPTQEDEAFSNSTQKLLRTLKTDPCVASLVRSFTYLGDDDATRAVLVYVPLLRELLEVCSGFMCLKLWVPWPREASASDQVALLDSIKEALKIVRPRLVLLDVLDNEMLWGDDVHAYLATFPSLKRLRLGELEDDRIGALLPAPAIQLDKFNGVGLMLSKALQTLLAGSHSTLTHLELIETISPRPFLELAPFVALRCLCLHLSFALNPPDLVVPLAPFLASLAALTSLRQLELAEEEGSYGPTDLVSLDLLRILPPFLTTLCINTLPLKTDYLLSALADDTCLRDLRLIDLDRQAYISGFDPWEDRRARPEGGREAIEGAAALRGIAVKWTPIKKSGAAREPEGDSSESEDDPSESE